MLKPDGKFVNCSSDCYATHFTVGELSTGSSYKFLVQALIYSSWSNYVIPDDLVEATTLDIRPNVTVDSLGNGTVVLK